MRSKPQVATAKAIEKLDDQANEDLAEANRLVDGYAADIAALETAQIYLYDRKQAVKLGLFVESDDMHFAQGSGYLSGNAAAVLESLEASLSCAESLRNSIAEFQAVRQGRSKDSPSDVLDELITDLVRVWKLSGLSKDDLGKLIELAMCEH